MRQHTVYKGSQALTASLYNIDRTHYSRAHCVIFDV